MSDETTPKWRKDFPIEWGADNYVTRREFTKFLVLTSGATAIGNSYFVVQRYREEHQKFASQQICRVDEIKPGEAKLFRYPTENDPALLIRLSTGELVAYKQRCTHLSCPVQYRAGSDRMECPCHNGAFDAHTGTVLEGPPPRPLPRITLVVENDTIFARGVEGS